MHRKSRWIKWTGKPNANDKSAHTLSLTKYEAPKYGATEFRVARKIAPKYGANEYGAPEYE